MKINPLVQSSVVSQYMSHATTIPQKTESVRAISGSDSVELSSGAQQYAELLRNTRNALDQSDESEDVHADEIMAQLNAGTYQVSDDDVIDALTGQGGIPASI